MRGCQSQVWLVPTYDAAADCLHLAIDSDAHIVRGLIAITLACYDGKAPAEIVDLDIEELFQELDLVSHLSLHGATAYAHGRQDSHIAAEHA